MTTNFNWNASGFFEHLTANNHFAQKQGFRFFRVSSLQGFHEMLNAMYSTDAFVAVSDTSDGTVNISNSPHTRRVKTVFLAMRHSEGDMASREVCFMKMRELFRQFMSFLLLEKTKVEEHNIFIDTRISFHEIERYFFTGCACAYFQISVDTYTDLVFRRDEWDCELKNLGFFTEEFTKEFD